MLLNKQNCSMIFFYYIFSRFSLLKIMRKAVSIAASVGNSIRKPARKRLASELKDLDTLEVSYLFIYCNLYVQILFIILLQIQDEKEPKKYIALLRAINVGNRRVTMNVLKTAFEKTSQEINNVKTFRVAGNIMFNSNMDINEEKIAEELGAQLGFEVPVIIKTLSQLQDIVMTNPFLKRKEIDITKLHVTFLKQGYHKDTNNRLTKLVTSPDECILVGQVIYQYCPNGYAKTKASNNAIEKIVMVSCTTRSWNTITGLISWAK